MADFLPEAVNSYSFFQQLNNSLFINFIWAVEDFIKDLLISAMCKVLICVVEFIAIPEA